MIREIKILTVEDIKKVSNIKIGDTVYIVDENTMKKKSFIEKIKRIQYYEMSRERKFAHLTLDRQFESLLVHLLAVKIFSENDIDYNHHNKEIMGIKNKIAIANIKNKSGEKESARWFSNKRINQMSIDYLEIAKEEFKNKFENVIKEHDIKNIDEILNNYNSLNDFSDIFKLYDDWRVK